VSLPGRTVFFSDALFGAVAVAVREFVNPLYVQRLWVFDTAMIALDRLQPRYDRTVLARERLRG
jgi:hypothetical protein